MQVNVIRSVMTVERYRRVLHWLLVAASINCATISAHVRAQVPPSSAERSGYSGIFAASAKGAAAQIAALVTKGAKPDARDNYGRTPLHVAAYGGHHQAMRTLVTAGVDPNALENDRYDIVTIAAVANDIPTLKLALELGGSAKKITSRYDGTALIAAAHLGHAEVTRMRPASLRYPRVARHRRAPPSTPLEAPCVR